jgi:hypothetical protein
LPLTLLTLADKVIPATLLGYLSLIAIFAKTAAIFEGSAVFEAVPRSAAE